jgi:hypothetical protein
MSLAIITRLGIIAVLTLSIRICSAADERPGLQQVGTKILKDGKPWRGTATMKQLYLNDRSEYFRRMDLTVALAEKYGIGLICSLFWPHWVQEMTGEKDLAAWATPGTKTHAAMATYVQEVVTRYRSSPANDKAYMLDAIEAVNRAWAKEMKQTRRDS